MRSRADAPDGRRDRRQPARPRQQVAREMRPPRCAALERHACRRPAASSCSSACATRIRRSPRRSAGWRSGWPPKGRPPRRLVRLEHQRQATMNVTVRNVITSMRLISWFDWAEFVESVSLVDEVLRDAAARSPRWTSPRGTATATRSRRWPAGRASPRSKSPQQRRWPTSARRPDVDRPTRSTRDPGYYLIVRRPPRAARRALKARVRPATRLTRAYVRYRGDRLPRHARRPHRARSSRFRCGGLVGRGATGHRGWRSSRSSPCCRHRDLAVALRQPHGRRGSSARDRLPRLDLEDGVPTSLRTLVVVPMLLDERGGRRSARRWTGGPLPRQSRRRPAIRPAVGLARRRQPSRCPATRSCWPRRIAAIDRLNERHGEAPGGGARFLLLPPQATLERGRGLLDGLGAQARQAPRAERAAARVDDDRHPRPDERSSTPPDGRSLCRHARRRHPAAARCRRTARRHDRPPAQSAALRRRGRPGDAAVTASSSRASRRRCRPSRGGRSSSGCSPARPASTRTPRRSPTSTRTCSRRAASPARASTTSMRSRRRWTTGCPRTRC